MRLVLWLLTGAVMGLFLTHELLAAHVLPSAGYHPLTTQAAGAAAGAAFGLAACLLERRLSGKQRFAFVLALGLAMIGFTALLPSLRGF